MQYCHHIVLNINDGMILVYLLLNTEYKEALTSTVYILFLTDNSKFTLNFKHIKYYLDKDALLVFSFR